MEEWKKTGYLEIGNFIGASSWRSHFLFCFFFMNLLCILLCFSE